MKNDFIAHKDDGTDKSKITRKQLLPEDRAEVNLFIFDISLTVLGKSSSDIYG